MSLDVAVSLRRHYSTFLAVLVTGVVLIIACGGTSLFTATCLECVFAVTNLISAYALAPEGPPAARP
ncbi:hypothetical protein [Streptomyces sp. NPDC023838]|uniref:hypothetical protein n=1 Tax=Streptomyces sp. NPDC023838 TaxID=3154325 RepID=UPI0033D580DB